MRNFKRFAAMASAALLAACAAAPVGMNAFAAANTITVKNEVGITHKYTAYQIFKGTAETSESGIITINGLLWANSDPAKANDFIGALKSNSCPIQNKTNELTAQPTAAEIAKFIETYVDDTNVNAFAKFLETQVGNFKQINSESSNEIGITDDGWYLVIDDTSVGLSANGAYSSYLLQNVDASEGAVLSFKGSAPSVVKKVEENTKTFGENDAVTNGYWTENDGYNDVADYSFGDAVPFRLEATLPSTEYYYDYEHYYLKFEDSLGTGFDVPTSLTIKIGSKEPVILSADNNWKDEGYGLTATIVSNTVTVELMDAKKANIALAAGEKVTVDYTAVLNADATVGRPGNYNDVGLEYSNNPKNTGDGTTKPDETGTTERDGVVVFTYGFDVHKYDGADTSKALLAGAEFAVRNFDNKYMCETKVDGKTTVTWEASTFENGKEVYPTNMKRWTSDTTNNITIDGLDDGTYFLVETKAPKGYNASGDIVFKVNATTNNTQTANDICAVGDALAVRTGKQLTELKINYIMNENGEYSNTNPSHTFAQAESSEGANDAVAEKNAVMYVENNSGAALPGTGGIGTTIFYAGGGAMVAVAGIFLITKKRMGKKDE